MKSRGRIFSLLTCALLVLLALPVGAQDMTYNESPVLAERVAAGELPPVEERLPENPLVIEGVDGIGTFGGTLRRVARPADGLAVGRFAMYEGLVNWNYDWTGIIPNVAESWEISDDATEYIFHLRQGIKWSDGVEFTSDDMVFFYEDILLDPEVSYSGAWMQAGGEYGVIEAIDDYTVKFTFAEPNALFMDLLPGPVGLMVVAFARHYWEQFLPQYNPDIDQLIEEAGVESYGELFDAVGGSHTGAARWNPDIPVLTAWRATNPFDANTTVLNLERNPYYFKVDPDGNQYPYIDNVEISVIEDAETMVLRAGAGEIDMQARSINATQNKPFYAENAEANGFHFIDLTRGGLNSSALSLNQSVQNEALREVFNNRDFRIGMSYAMDRQRIIDTIFVSQGEPAQIAPGVGDVLYNETLEKQYTEHDVDLANEHLDAAGLTQRDADGFRLMSNGERVSFVFIYAEDAPFPPEAADILQMLSEDWAEVGVEMIPRGLPRTTYSDLVISNDYDAAVWLGGWSTLADMSNPIQFIPMNGPFAAEWGAGWAIWYQNPDDALAVEPPDEVKELLNIWEEIKVTADREGREALMARALQIHQENLFVFGLSTAPNGYAIVTNRTMNVPMSMPDSWPWPTPGPALPYTWYLAE